MVLAPPSAQGTTWLRRFGEFSDAFASGWMQIRGTRRRRGTSTAASRCPIIADWPALQAAIAATGAEPRVRHARVIERDGALAARARARCAGVRTEYGEEDDRGRDGERSSGERLLQMRRGR
jgi:putative mRNA 3-end processing factor